MSTQVQLRRGTAAQHNSFVGAPGEITVDTTNNNLRVHDGVTPGGHPLTLQSLFNAHLAERVSQVITVQRDLSIAGTQTITTLTNRKIKSIYALAAVQNTKKMSQGIWGESGEAYCIYTAGDTGNFLNGTNRILIFSDQSNVNRTDGVLIPPTQPGSFKIDWTKVGTGATGLAEIRFLVMYHGE